MNTQSIVTVDKLTSNTAMAEAISSYSLDLLKFLRFDFGKVDHNRMREILRMNRLVCSRYCKLGDEDKRGLREAIIRKNVLKLREL